MNSPLESVTVPLSSAIILTSLMGFLLTSSTIRPDILEAIKLIDEKIINKKRLKIETSFPPLALSRSSLKGLFSAILNYSTPGAT